MVQGGFVGELRVVPGRHDLEDEEPVAGHQAAVGEPAFEAGKAFADQRRGDELGGLGAEAEGGELVEGGAG